MFFKICAYFMQISIQFSVNEAVSVIVLKSVFLTIRKFDYENEYSSLGL